jgi:DNA-binding CsgD family transcriptional regulator
MDDNKKSKKQLIKELKTARHRIAELREQNRLKFKTYVKKENFQKSLLERVKELSCLYGIAELIDRSGSSIEKILQGIADLLPGSWQYPEITCGRVAVDEKKYVSTNFKTSRWKQAADIKVGDEKVGTVEVYYLEKKPTLDEGPFLKEERLLINAVAERIGKTIKRIRAERQLEIKRAALDNMNIALREVLAKVEDEKKEISVRIQDNVDKVIMPILFAIKNDIPCEKQGYVNLLKENLEQITSAFTSKLAKAFMSLTPVEIQICNMIKSGLSTKEIAGLRYVSPATVNRHREHIRKKLGITNKNVNLTTYLQAFMSDA